MTDYTQVGEESPREVCANLVMTLRDAANDIELDPETGFVDPDELRDWATRLERAVAKLDGRAEALRQIASLASTIPDANTFTGAKIATEIANLAASLR